MSVEVLKEQLEKLLEKKTDRLSERLLAWKQAWEIGPPGKEDEVFRRLQVKILYENAFTVEEKKKKDLFPKAVKGVDILPLQEAKEKYAAFFYNRAQKEGRETFFSKINEALEEEGIFIYVPPHIKVEEPIVLSKIYEEGAFYYTPRIHLFVGSNACVEILQEEIHARDASYMVNQVIDIALDPKAECLLVEKRGEASSPVLLYHLHANCKRESTLKIISCNSGSKLLYQSYDIRLLQEGAKATLKGVWDLEKEKKSHTHVYISHEAERTFSEQHFKGVLRDRSRSTFEGKIYVYPVAQKTEAYQLNNNLLLDKGASCFTKPNLEIFADDVKASHGATVKDLSPEEIFYIQSRGISIEKGKELLSRGFLESILKEISF